jgi:hypothetical protein
MCTQKASAGARKTKEGTSEGEEKVRKGYFRMKTKCRWRGASKKPRIDSEKLKQSANPTPMATKE